MRNPLRRLVNRDPAPRFGGDMALSMRRNVGPGGLPRNDDYLVEGEQQEMAPAAPAATRLIQTLQALLILVMAVLSFAIFWLLGLLFNIF